MCGLFPVNNVLKLGPGSQSSPIHGPLCGSRVQPASYPLTATKAGTVQICWLDEPVHLRSSIWWSGVMHKRSQLWLSTPSESLSYTGIPEFHILFRRETNSHPSIRIGRKIQHLILKQLRHIDGSWGKGVGKARPRFPSLRTGLVVETHQTICELWSYCRGANQLVMKGKSGRHPGTASATSCWSLKFRCDQLDQVLRVVPMWEVQVWSHVLHYQVWSYITLHIQLQLSIPHAQIWFIYHPFKGDYMYPKFRFDHTYPVLGTDTRISHIKLGSSEIRIQEWPAYCVLGEITCIAFSAMIVYIHIFCMDR